jgi:predicted RNase H-like HicB family nuclease
MIHQNIHISYSPADQGYIAEFEGLPYCLGFGLSPIMALHELLQAKEQIIKTAKEQGITAPQNNQLPVEKNAFRETGMAIWNN